MQYCQKLDCEDLPTIKSKPQRRESVFFISISSSNIFVKIQLTYCQTWISKVPQLATLIKTPWCWRFYFISVWCSNGILMFFWFFPRGIKTSNFPKSKTYWCVSRREWMGIGVAEIIIRNYYGSFPHSLRFAPVRRLILFF